MADEPLPGGWLPPSDREYTPPPPLPDEPARDEPHGRQPGPAGDIRGWVPPAPPGPARPASNAKANWSLALGIGGLIVCPLVLSVLALVLGYQARREIDASGGQQENRGTANAGIITGWVGLVVGIALLVLIAAGVDIGFDFETSS